MLLPRILTGIVLLCLVLAVILWLPPLWFNVSMGMVLVIGAWEWTRLAGLEARGARLAYVAAVLVALPLLQIQPEAQRRMWLAAGCLWWVYAYFLVRRYPSLSSLWERAWLPAIAGLLVLLPGWSALLALRAEQQHVLLLLLLLAMVAAADIGAYFSGKAWGRHRLAPQVSPNKTWEGFAGGMVASCLVALLIIGGSGVAGSFSAGLVLKIVAISLSVAVTSVVGDLFESMVKRRAGVKDSGSLLPGHGGVLDRIDSIAAALPLYTVTLDWLLVP